MISNFSDLLDNITPEVYQQLKRAVELGKWPTGDALSKEQRQLCMQAVIAYEETNLTPEQRSGFIPPKAHSNCGSKKADIADSDEQPLQFK